MSRSAEDGPRVHQQCCLLVTGSTRTPRCRSARGHVVPNCRPRAVSAARLPDVRRRHLTAWGSSHSCALVEAGWPPDQASALNLNLACVFVPRCTGGSSAEAGWPVCCGWSQAAVQRPGRQRRLSAAWGRRCLVLSPGATLPCAEGPCSCPWSPLRVSWLSVGGHTNSVLSAFC